MHIRFLGTNGVRFTREVKLIKIILKHLLNRTSLHMILCQYYIDIYQYFFVSVSVNYIQHFSVVRSSPMASSVRNYCYL